jgi:hypothetical protein
MATAHPDRDDSTNRNASLDPVGVDDGERDSLSQPDSDNSILSVVPALVLTLQRGSFEDKSCELKVESTQS